MLRVATSVVILLGLVTGCAQNQGDVVAPLTSVDNPSGKDGWSTVTGGDVSNADTNGGVAKPVTPARAPSLATRRCDTTKPFGAPEPMTTLNAPGGTEVYPMLSADELTITFTRVDASWLNPQTFTATRTSTSAQFGEPVAETLVAGGSRISMFGTLTVADFRADPAGLRHLYGPNIPLLDQTVEQAEPYAANETAVYYTAITTLPGGPAWQIQRVTREAGAVPTAVLPLPDMTQVWPVVSADETQIWLAQGPRDGSGSWDIVTAKRFSVDEPFGSYAVVGELSGPTTSDLPSWISADGCTMAMVSNRVDTTLDIYLAHRPQ